MVHKITILALLAALAAVTSAAAAPRPVTYALAGEPKQGSFKQTVRYEDNKIVRLHNPSAKVRELVSTGKGLDLWGAGTDHIDVRVKNLDAVEQLKARAQEAINYSVIVDNLQPALDKQTESLNKVHTDASADWFSAYHTYPDIVSYLSQTCSSHSQLCTSVASIGKSVEGRDIVAYRLTSSKGDRNSKPQIFFQGLQHAREWAATTTVQYIFTQLLTQYGTNTQATQLLDSAEVIIVPLSNPDGYLYTWNGDRLWRKNRRNNGDGTYGVDLNRNWDYNWGQGGSSSDTNDDTYMGPSAGSEPEVQAMEAFFKQCTRVVAAIDFHTFSQLILRPWGTTSDDTPHEPLYLQASNNVYNTIKSVHGTEYVVEKEIDLYVTSGTAPDYWYTIPTSVNGQTTYPMAITIELRPDANNSEQGFVLPPDQIRPLGEEIYPASLQYALSAIANPLTDANKNGGNGGGGNGGGGNGGGGNGGNPNDPGNGGDPNDPGNGGDPNDPGNGGDPNDPGNGGDPNDPGNGGDPSDPGDGGDPWGSWP
ncbi:hypothetical protein RI367_007667 [Sorochytrium milnesiophthora]